MSFACACVPRPGTACLRVPRMVSSLWGSGDSAAFGLVPALERWERVLGLPRRGRRHPAGAHAGAVSASLRLHCAARTGVAPRTRFVRCAHYAQTDGAKSVLDARFARRPQSCAARHPRNRPRRVPPAALSAIRCMRRENTSADLKVRVPAAHDLPTKRREALGFCCAGNQRVEARQALPAGGDFCGGEQRSLEVGARSAHQRLNSPRLFERSERSERSEFGARLQGEHHSGVGAKRRPPQHEPLAGSACRAAPTQARVPNVQRSAMGRKAPFSSTAAFHALQVTRSAVEQPR
jgi:hypothetical protein